MITYLKYSFLCLVLFCGMVIALNYNVPRTDTAPVIDGNIAAGEWDKAAQILVAYPDIVTLPKKGSLNSATFAPDNHEDLSAKWYLMWDHTAIYLACRVYDNQLYWLIERGAGNYSQDGVQFLFNFKKNPAAGYRAEAAVIDFAPRTATNALPDIYKRDPGIYDLPNSAIGSTIFADGYFIEVKLPWSDFDAEYNPTNYSVNDPNNIHGAGLVHLDYDDVLITGPGSSIISDFGGGSYNPSDINSWNTITLVESLVCGDLGILHGDFNKDCNVDFLDFSILAQNWFLE